MIRMNTIMNEKTIKAIAQAAAVEVLQNLGITAGEISRNRAISVYGKWFKDAEEQGRLNPIRVGTGRTGTKWYAVSDILALKANDLAVAEAQLKATA